MLLKNECCSLDIHNLFIVIQIFCILTYSSFDCQFLKSMLKFIVIVGLCIYPYVLYLFLFYVLKSDVDKVIKV